MINLLFTIILVLLTQASSECRRIEGSYRIADGRGRSVGIEAQVEQTECSITVRFDEETHQAKVEGDHIFQDRTMSDLDGETRITGDIDGEGRILWSNGFYYIPSHMEDELFPAECLHPFALYCHETCSRCVPCANGEEHDWCDACSSCEMCLDYVPCLEPVQHMPECLEPDAFECLRECRECANFEDCMEVQQMVDPLCLTPQAAECLDQCAHCAPCATGEASDVDCDQCGQCSSCQDYATCLDQAKLIPEDKQKCVSSEAIECFIECEDCADKMYCLDAFAVEVPSNPDVCAQLESKYPECGAGYEGELDCSPSQEDMDYYNEHCQNDSDGMCAELEAKYPECGHEYEGELDCSPSQEDIDYYNEHCKDDSDDRDCHSCVLDFSAAGGCDMWLRGEDPTGVIPPGCDSCAEEAADFCGIPEEDLDDGDSKVCCRSYNADCLSCVEGVSVDEFCQHHLQEFVPGCEHVFVAGEKFVEIKDYPCSTHGQEAPNQMYRMVGMGANGFEIFQGTSNPVWWIYYDSNCGMTDPAHAPAWYLTTEEPDFGALENLGGNFGGCTNTLRFDEIGTFEPRLDMHVDSYYCDNRGWLSQTGRPVIVDMGFKRDDPLMCCQAMTAECMACKEQISVDEFCRVTDVLVPGCEHIPVFTKFVEIKNYPCSTHGQQAPNQMYHMVGMGANGFEIFQGTSNPAWWIYYDTNCGMTDPAHPPAWYLTTEEPDFEALENLGGRFGGCTNTLRIDDNGTFEPRLDMHVDSYFCDNQGWLHHTGRPVIVDMGFKRDEPVVCCEAVTAECMACQQQITVDEFCRRHTDTPFPGCEHTHEVPLNIERCMTDSDCQFEGCAISGENTREAYCSGSMDAMRDCSKGECVCVASVPDALCDDREGHFPQVDGSSCENGQRNFDCPVNQYRQDCLAITDGNYEIKDVEGKPVAHMMMNQLEGCTGDAKMTDGAYLRLQLFREFIIAETADQEVYTGVPNAFGGYEWNGMFQSYPISCIIVYQGTYIVVSAEGEVQGRHTLFQDGCTATSTDDEFGEALWNLTPDAIVGYVGEQHLQGRVDHSAGPFVIRWDNGYTSRPVMDDEEPECIEDGHALLSYVRSVAVNEANPKIRGFITHIEMAGCDVLRHDHDAKFDWCTFHPEARRACSCVCEEVNKPKPVCDREQMESWLKRDLSSECTELFIAGLAGEHRSACECMRTMSDHDAHEMFSSECYFHDWSDRSFMQLWRDCN